MTRLELPREPRILIVALRRLGDVLLTTPLMRAVRKAHPDARIDVLVFSDTAAILEGNPDIDTIVRVAPRASARQSLATAARLWRRYDLAITTQAGDRPTFFAIVAGRRRAGPVEDRLSGTIKKLLLHRRVRAGGERHRVEDMLALARALGLDPAAQVVAPDGIAPAQAPSRPYAVIHAAPMFHYKRWHRDGWRAIAQHLAAKGLAVVATGGPADDERRYLDEIFAGLENVTRLDGQLSWPELSALLAGARIFLGPDTSVTHLAAAAGCPVIALYGPTDPRLWAPWPAGGLDRPWEASAEIQTRGNVRLVQCPMPCQPCQQEGCLRHLQSYSLCLDQLPAERVIGVLDTVLNEMRVPGN